MDINWTTPPPLDTKHGRAKAFVAQLQTRPGQWALYPLSIAQRSGATYFRRLGCEAQTRERTDGRFDLYLMWPERSERNPLT